MQPGNDGISNAGLFEEEDIEVGIAFFVDVKYDSFKELNGKERCPMEWINISGLIFMIIIMIPNIVFAVKCKDGFENLWENKRIEILEQIGRFGCFGFMIVHIPGTWFGFVSDETFVLYLIGDSVFIFVYCLIWVLCFKKNSVFRALALSIIPSVLFLYSGIMCRSILLIVAALIFAPCHIIISYKNAVLSGTSATGSCADSKSDW